jgi:hypothetical protein
MRDACGEIVKACVVILPEARAFHMLSKTFAGLADQLWQNIREINLKLGRPPNFIVS